jgi:glycosyltransferase involved in cell wall biosynthesis
MTIGIDCSAVAGERSGLGQYAFNLVHALSEIDTANRYLLYILFPVTNYLLHRELVKVDLPDKANFRIFFRKIPVPYQLMRYLRVPGFSAKADEFMLGNLPADIVHSTTFSVPRFRNRKKRLVVTIYDLTVLTHPEYHQKLNIRHCLEGIKDAVRYADRIIAISDHTKQDLMDHFRVPSDMIEVTPLAAGRNYRPVTDSRILDAARKKYGLPPRYVLFLGSLEPRKNVDALVQAYARLPEKLREEFSLVVAGARGWLNSEVHKAVEDLKIGSRVHFTGYVAEEDMSAVYSMSTVFVYPSFYEGFGLPVLEAMSCGAPVITSNTSSMPEVAGDAARLVSPKDIDEIAGALESVLEDEETRDRMRTRGLKRASGFSWEKCARQTLDIYQNVMAK